MMANLAGTVAAAKTIQPFHGTIWLERSGTISWKALRRSHFDAVPGGTLNPLKQYLKLLLRGRSVPPSLLGVRSGTVRAELHRPSTKQAAHRMSRNVVSHSPDIGLPTFVAGPWLGDSCGGRGFAGSLGAVSDSLAAIERIGGAPTAHGAAFEPVNDRLGLATATTDLADMVQTRRHAFGLSDGKTFTFRLRPHDGQSHDGQAARRDPLAAVRTVPARVRTRGWGWWLDLPRTRRRPTGGKKTGRRLPAATSRAHHFALLSGIEMGNFWQNNSEKPVRCGDSAGNKCGNAVLPR